jgi:hypothetical protein
MKRRSAAVRNASCPETVGTCSGPEVAFVKVTAESETNAAHASRGSSDCRDRAGGICRRVVLFIEGVFMNLYKSIGYAAGTPEALALAARLSAWHDAMVAHERPADTLRITHCDDDCPHADAKVLWRQALDVFGGGADQMRFLRRHGSPSARTLRTAPFSSGGGSQRASTPFEEVKQHP